MQYIIKGESNEGIEAKVLSTWVLLNINKIQIILHFSFSLKIAALDLIKIFAVHQQDALSTRNYDVLRDTLL